MVVAILVAVFGRFLAPQNPYDLTAISLADSYLPPVWLDGGKAGFLLGSDEQGRDILSAIIYGSASSIMIGLVGMICSMLGRMLGDISPLWGIPIGGLFIWLGLNLMGIKACKLPSGSLGNLKMRGYGGALFLGLAYGVLSGACTFGFIAPILAIITVQEEVAKGLSLILFFALGHCLPIVVAGSSAALAQRVLAGKGMQTATVWGRRIAGGLVMLIGVYFIISAITGS